jgi:protein-tyrosine phosphatase
MNLGSYRSPSQVLNNLWQGGIPDPNEDLSKNFDLVVLVAEEFQPEYLSGVRVVHAPLTDEQFRCTTSERRLVCAAVHEVVKALKHGLRVLVTCHQGLNRSGLITALALRQFYGMSADEAITRVRYARGPFALSNPIFEQMIKD